VLRARLETHAGGGADTSPIFRLLISKGSAGKKGGGRGGGGEKRGGIAIASVYSIVPIIDPEGSYQLRRSIKLPSRNPTEEKGREKGEGGGDSPNSLNNLRLLSSAEGTSVGFLHIFSSWERKGGKKGEGERAIAPDCMDLWVREERKRSSLNTLLFLFPGGKGGEGGEKEEKGRTGHQAGNVSISRIVHFSLDVDERVRMGGGRGGGGGKKKGEGRTRRTNFQKSGNLSSHSLCKIS